MKRNILATVLSVMVLGVTIPAGAQKPRTKPTQPTVSRQARRPTVRHSLALTAFRTTYDDPFLREPGQAGTSSPEVRTGQSVRTASGRVSWLATLGRGGIEAGLSYVRAPLRDFTYYNPEGMRDTVAYSAASVTLIQADIALLGAPARGVPLFLYGVLGMGLAKKNFTVSGSVFPEWDGQRTLNEFGYSAGVGFRLSPIRQVSLVGEFRWVPGDQSTSIPSGGCYIYYARQDGRGLSASVASGRGAAGIPTCKSTTKSGHLVSLGVSVAVP